MTKRLHDIANSLTFTGLLLPAATLLVTEPESLHGVFVAKQFWFYSSLAIAGLIALLLVLFNQRSISCIDMTKTIFLGILTVVIIDISRNQNREMMNANLLLLVIISYFFFNIIFNYNRKSGKIFQFILIAFVLLEVLCGYFQQYAGIPENQTTFSPTGSMYSAKAYALFLAIISPIALYWTITLYKKLKDRQSSSSLPDEKYAHAEMIDDVLLFLLSALGLVAILSILPLTQKPFACFVAGSGCVMILWTTLHAGKWLKQIFFKTKECGLAFKIVAPLVICIICTGIYRFEKDAIDERLLMWKISLNILAEKPLTGIGIGNFPKTYGDAQSAYFERGGYTAREATLANNPSQSINDLLQITIETGIIGLILSASLVAMILKKGIRQLKEHPEQLPVLGALVSFTVACVFTSPLSSLSLSIIFMLLLALGTSQNTRVKYKYSRVPVIAVSVVLTGMMVNLVYPQYHKLEAYKKWAQGRLYYNMEIYATAANIYSSLTETLKENPKFMHEYGIALSETERYEESNAVLQQTAQVLADPMIYSLIGKNYQALGNYQLAEQSFQKAHFMVPHHMYPHFLLAKLYHEMGLPDKTFLCPQRVILQKPKKNSSETQDMKFQMQELIRNINHISHQ